MSDDTPTAPSLEREKVGPIPIWGWGILAGLAVWTLYVLTLAPTTAFWDASEYIATAHILGIPHPPGNPFFVILGRTWDVLLGWTGLSVAQRINLLSATMSGGAAVFWFLSVARIWNHFTENRRLLVLVSFLSVMLGGTAFTVWYQSNVNAKVYTVSLFIVALVSYLALKWEDYSGTRRGDRLVLVVFFIIGLGATNHLMSALPLGALGLYILWHDWRHLLRWKLIGTGVALALIGFSLQGFFPPIRSAQNPVIDEGNPECESLWKAAPTAVNWLPVAGAVVPESAVCSRLDAVIKREQYNKPSLTERQAPFQAQLANYWQYFDWQWARPLPRVPRGAVTMLFVFFGLIGLWRHWKGDRDSFVYMGTLLFTVTVLLVFYLNFQYGYSLYPDVPMSQHEVRERDYFYIVSFNLWGLWAGMGIVTLWQQLAGAIRGGASGLGRDQADLPGDRRRSYLWASPILALAFLPLALNFSRADRSGDYSARDWAYNLLQSVEPYGILITNGDNDTFPLWYLQEVEGIRKDVTVIVSSYLGTDWYPGQLRELTAACEEGEDPTERPTVIVCQRPFEEDEAVGPYAEMDPEKPEHSILDMSDQEIRSLQPVARFGEAQELTLADGLTVEVSGGTRVFKPDILTFRILRYSLGDRPVYFAATAPPAFRTWNLGPHLLRQALGFKLETGVIESTTDTVQLSRQFGVRWVDVDRSQALLWDVFQVNYLLDWALWPEPSTRSSIPAQYYLAYMSLGEALRMREQQSAAERNYQRAQQLLQLSERGTDEGQ